MSGLRKALIGVLLGGLVGLMTAPYAFAGPMGTSTGPRVRGYGSHVDPYHPDFEFAPGNGAGMGTACGCTTPSGVLGTGAATTLTLIRASSGTCLKGNTASGIVSGDLVTCSTNQPRVMPGGDGSGATGLLVETARTNLELRSVEFDNAAWVKEAGVTVSANDVACPLAPDGTRTMDLVTFAGNSAGIYQLVAITNNNTVANSVFLSQKSGGAACTLSVKDGATSVAKTIAVLNSTISRPEFSVTAVGTSAGLYIQEDSPTDCVDACVWGAQTEQGAVFASSYIATTSAAVTRATEQANFPAMATLASAGSGAATVVVPAGITSTHGILQMNSVGVIAYHHSSGVVAAYDGTNNPQKAVTFSNSPRRYAGSWGSNLTIYDITGGTSTSSAFDGTMGVTEFCVASGSAGGACGTTPLDGVIKQVCADSSETRCR